ncbi:hypothetical protein [Hymenobacter edaphi]|uniref:Uncharacterized protein n=1 Tax=Hymenobacter edaphi TaxID=2211146 RepID=A0A328BBU5_9BACT|nr:hypothetical protein [Hymenobacter edaphi]RAK63891.1 hypothetical protein DLM85_20310 [Hymenobacter edaphi]
MERYVDLVCASCGKAFQRREAKRNQRLGRQAYCTRACSGRASRENLPAYDPAATYVIARHAANYRDRYTGFREHLRRCCRRGHDATTTLDDLVQQWENQQGKCPYTGLTLVQPGHHACNDVIHTASLDRIDSRLGYVAGNVQFVSMAINYAKNTLTHTEMVMLCRVIAQHWQLENPTAALGLEEA